MIARLTVDQLLSAESVDHRLWQLASLADLNDIADNYVVQLQRPIVRAHYAAAAADCQEARMSDRRRRWKSGFPTPAD